MVTVAEASDHSTSTYPSPRKEGIARIADKNPCTGARIILCAGCQTPD